MIADRDTNVVFVADTLPRRFPTISSGLQAILAEHGIPLRTIPGTRDIWCRDYMPIQVAEDRFVQFRYAPDYLGGKFRHLRADGEIGPALAWLGDCRRSEIVLDGGNVVARGHRAIVTDKVFRENPKRTRRSVEESLRRDLAVSELIDIPCEPDDPIGHSNGMACWLDEQTVLINDDSVLGTSFRRRVHHALRRRGIVPYEPRSGGRGGIPTAAGNWMNFLRVRDVLIVPAFGLEGDRRAVEILADVHPGQAVESVDCRALATEGGLLRCVTWQVLRVDQVQLLAAD
jgi:agmatine/peptidylarginine deiminase